MTLQQEACNTSINYTDVIGTRILPFLIQLDLSSSILNPAPGQNQRFCYIVTGVGQDQPEFADLSHIVFGICNQITASQIVNVTVTIDGIPQDITGKVELRTSQNPDPPTGCPGLKFDFGLDKVGGVMNICYELTTTYPVGPNPVCLFGGNTTATGLSICGPVCQGEGMCETTGFQPASVCTPVTVKPFANAGGTTTKCCGNPIVNPGSTTCAGTTNGSCTFTISQNICVTVPVEFGAISTVGAPSVQCGEATSQDICTNCGNGNSSVVKNKIKTSNSCSCCKG